MSGPVDFVINRKRKRSQAIDPCLGFYEPPSVQTEAAPTDPNEDAEAPVVPASPNSSARPEHATERVNDQHEPPPSPEITEPGEPPIVTVDAFLRWSAQKSVKKYTGRKRLRRNEDDDDNSYRPSMSSSPVVAPSSPSRKPLKMTKMTKPERPKRIKSLAQRLMEAAALTRVDVDEEALPGSMAPAKPVITQRVTSLIEQPTQSRVPKRPLIMVDPHTTTPFRNMTFISQQRISSAIDRGRAFTTPRKPVTIRRNLQATSHRTSPRNRQRTSSRRPMDPPPLNFVSIEDAERSYAKRRLSKSTQPKLVTSPCVNVIPSPKKRIVATDRFKTPPAHEPTNDDDDLFAPSYALAQPADSEPVAASPFPVTPPQPSQWLMRPLASYLDQFLDNIRTVARAVDESAKKRPTLRSSKSRSPIRRPPTTISRVEEDVVLESPSKPAFCDDHDATPFVRPNITAEMLGISPFHDAGERSTPKESSPPPSSPTDFVVTLHNSDGHIIFSPSKIVRIPCNALDFSSMSVT